MKTTIDYKLFGNVVALEIRAATAKHPNKMTFSGVLVRIDEASSKAPQGSDGHKILIPRALAEKELKTLIGMPVNYHAELNQHQPGRPVGVIQKAKIEGKDIVISGVIWKKSFPEAVKDLSSSKLGMSFEASEISVEDKKATIWTLSSLCFTGATILYKDAAAYYNTSAKAIAAAASNAKIVQWLKLVQNSKKKGAIMATQEEKIAAKKLKAKKLKAQEDKLKAAADQAALVSALTAAMAPVVSAIQTQTESIQSLQASMDAHLDAEGDDEDVDAAGENDDDEEEEEEVPAGKKKKKVKAAGKKTAKKSSKKKIENDDEDDDEDDGDDDEDDEDMESGADDEDELDDLGDDDDEDDTPGNLNPPDRVANKGNKVPQKDAGKKMKAAAQVIERQNQTIKNLRRTLKAQEESISAAASRVDRRSISCSAVMATTLSKGNLDIASLVAEGQKVSIPELDTMSAAAGLNSTQSMALKNEAVRMGILEE